MLISRLDGHLSQSCDRRDQRDQTTLTPAQWSVRHCVYSIYTQATDVDDLTWSCYTGGEKPRSVSDEIINNVNELSASSSARTLTQPQTSNLQCFHFTTILQHNAVRVKFSNKIEHCKETLPKSQVLPVLLGLRVDAIYTHCTCGIFLILFQIQFSVQTYQLKCRF